MVGRMISERLRISEPSTIIRPAAWKSQCRGEIVSCHQAPLDEILWGEERSTLIGCALLDGVRRGSWRRSCDDWSACGRIRRRDCCRWRRINWGGAGGWSDDHRWGGYWREPGWARGG